ncbi:MAG: carbohydrate ABC transporter permease [Armatimonadetes bacterium]|nr:carbohydrate ABC transporter permease [Armatimonadota bacterium]
MSLVSKVGRKRPRARIALAVLYAILTFGALTTLYPFLLMVSTGLKGPTDQSDNAIVPKYFGDDNELLAKYLDDKYAGNDGVIASTRSGPDSNEVAKFDQFLMTLPLDMWTSGFRLASNQVTSRLTMRYQEWLRTRFKTVDDLNKAYIEENIAFQTVMPPSELLERASWKPTPGQKYTDWLEFKATLPAEYRIPIRRTRLWQEFLRVKFRNRIDDVPDFFKVHNEKKFEELTLDYPEATTVGNIQENLMLEFERTIPDRYKHGTAEALWAKESREAMPIEASERAYVRAHEGEIKRNFATRNFRYVLDYVLLHGTAVLNTAIFCGLAVLTQLLVNPLAAYALSRYPIRSSGRILLFLLATMAFPAEVAMIPAFLLLKSLHLLNTFAALILPSAASGYMIFLLKGFFDSLPQELFEAGQLDGAPETTLLTRIALPLTRPVLGYLALMAFMASYSTFMFAFLVVQDQKMWTLMVWVYQLQTTAPKAVVMAALALAALPTLVVFLFAQRVIMRGIVLPGER